MDVFETLRHDHSRIAALIQKLREPDVSAAEAREVCHELRETVSAHNAGVERSFYPLFPETERVHQLIDDARAEAEALIDQLDGLALVPSGSTRWRLTVARIEELLRHHVLLEERRLAPRARELLSAGMAVADTAVWH